MSVLSDEVFSTRSSLDSIFNAPRQDYNKAADALVVAFEDGTLYLSIYDFFEIGSFNLGKRYGVKQLFSHPYSSTHGILVSDRVPGGSRLSLIPLDLQLIPNTGKYLSLIASKSTQMQNLLRYITGTQAQMSAQFASSQDLPRNFMRNMEETLQEKNEGSFVSAIYHLVATGHCYASVKEWLVDVLADRVSSPGSESDTCANSKQGQKRWEKAALSGYENLRRLAHENLIPALERFSILASRLRGLSRFHETNTTLGLESVEFDHIFDTLSCMQLLAHTVLLQASSELQQAGAFCHWLRNEIQVQSMDGSSPGAEILDKDPMLDYPRILEYVQGALQNSSLFEAFETQPGAEGGPGWATQDESDLIYPRFRAEMRSRREGIRTVRQLPGLRTLTARLQRQCNAVFGRMAQMQKRKVRVGDPIPLEDGHSDCFDTRMKVPVRICPRRK